MGPAEQTSGWTSTRVVCRAEGRADQRPTRFLAPEGWTQVEALEREWLEQGPDPTGPVFRVFQVDTQAGPFLLRVQEPGWLWQMRKIPVASEHRL